MITAGGMLTVLFLVLLLKNRLKIGEYKSERKSIFGNFSVQQRVSELFFERGSITLFILEMAMNKKIDTPQ